MLFDEFSNIFVNELPNWLPPLRVINHQIPLIDKAQRINPVVYAVPDKFKE